MSQARARVVDLAASFAMVTEAFRPKVIARLNDYKVQVVTITGAFVWHTHAETDEFFLVIRGQLSIETRAETLSLSRGQLCVIPRGIEHRPRAEQECQVLLIEPTGTVNTGELVNERTASDVGLER